MKKFIILASIVLSSLTTSCSSDDSVTCNTTHYIKCDTQDNLLYIDNVAYTQQYNFDNTWNYEIGFHRSGAQELTIVSTKTILNIVPIEFTAPNVVITYVNAHKVTITSSDIEQHFDNTDYFKANITLAN